MDNKENKTRLYFLFAHALFTILLVSGNSNQALAENVSYLELTKSRHSETLGDIVSFGLFSKTSISSSSDIYGGVQLMEIERDNLAANNSTIKIVIGQSFGKTIIPFYEIGTDLFGLLMLLDNDHDVDPCAENQQCSIDFFFRIGIRIKINQNLSIGVFHENIDFGDFHTSLSGEYRYVGSSLIYEF